MKLSRAATYCLIAFMAAWQATDFSLDYRAILGASVAGFMAVLSPNAEPVKDEVIDSSS
jgi:hypothetical protein